MGGSVTITLHRCISCCNVPAAASPMTEVRRRRCLPCPMQPHPVLRFRRKHSVAAGAKVADDGARQRRPSDGEKGLLSGNPAGFHPSIWGDFFLHYDNPASPVQQTLMEERARALKEEVAKMISSSSTSSLPERLHFIYVLERLCLDYLFDEEITGMLAQISNADVNDCDLHTVAMWFYLLRIHRYRVSPDVFGKFKNEEGRFVWQNPRDLLSLYNAAYLRMHGETILNEAISFTERELKSMIPYLEQDGPFAREINRALDIPIPRRVRIYDAKYYISIYENDTTVDRMVLELAKLNSNLVQIRHQQELKILTRWWKDIRLQADFSFSRDRIVENYFWMVGAYFEPCYSRARIILTMVMATTVILDDFFDSYGTSQECDSFTKCIEWFCTVETIGVVEYNPVGPLSLKYPWDQKEAQDLPNNIKLVLKKILQNYKTIEDHLGPHEKHRISYLRSVVVDVVRAYNMEVKWRDERYVPATVEEHLRVSARSGACHLLSCASFVGCSEIAAKESFEWVSSMPKMVHALCKILRLSDDLEESYEQGQMILDVASIMDSCMKEYNVSMGSARKKIKELIEESWMDINEEWLNKHDKAQPKELLERIFNLTRTMEFMYKQGDALTTSHAVKGTINSLLVESFTNI
ncbi:hypothetical protein ACP70R_021223 [Stipagrostis hirtigluma subsp. patula]